MYKKSLTFSEEGKVLNAEILQALKCMDANWSFQSANDEAKRYRMVFLDSQIPKGFKLGKTKTIYTIQFGVVPHFQELWKTDLKNTAFTFKFDERTN